MRKHLILLLLIIGGVSCDTSPDLVNCDFDEKAMLTNYADNIIIPQFSDLNLSLVLMESSFQAFIDNPTVGLLNEARIFYGTSYSQYQVCSSFNFGPGLVSGLSFTERFNTFPVNLTTLNQAVSNGDAVSASGNSIVGYPAIDYLLFGTPGTTDNDILTLYTTDNDAANRKQFLMDLASELKSTAENIELEWKPSGGNYRETFINNLGTAEGSSISLLVNGFNFDFETLKNFKFKIPLGKFNGGVVIPEQVEAYYGGGSAQLAQRQMEGLKSVYEGNSENGANNPGLYEYLLCLETDATAGGLLADEVRAQLENVEQAVLAIQDPMSEALTTDFATVDNAYIQMQMTVPLVKHEMTAALGVQISYQDNDGD